jgi:hypothetical protein
MDSLGLTALANENGYQDASVGPRSQAPPPGRSQAMASPEVAAALRDGEAFVASLGPTLMAVLDPSLYIRGPLS